MDVVKDAQPDVPFALAYEPLHNKAAQQRVELEESVDLLKELRDEAARCETHLARVWKRWTGLGGGTLALLVLLAGTAYAQAGRVVIECATPLTVTQSPPPSTPPPPPPPPPPLPPPPVVPPIVDTSPFPFPRQQPGQEDGDGDARYIDLCPASGGCYASLPEFDNPLFASHAWACYLPAGMRYRGVGIGGMRLYVRRDFPPASIRTLCAGGALP